jgi:predicted aconitase with swiveling domain
MERVINGKAVIRGQAQGVALVSDEPLSFWGGYDWQTGEITDRRHPLSGQIAAGRVLCLPFSRGSSTTTAVLLEAIRNDTAPAAILTTASDFFFALASVVADELYTHPVPLIALESNDFARLNTGDQISIQLDGTVLIRDS